MVDKEVFNISLIKDYPKANKKIELTFSTYALHDKNRPEEIKGSTNFVSPFGLEFSGPTDYPIGTLLKINLELPDYWDRKKKFVDYNRIDTPSQLKILAKVVQATEIGKRVKRKVLTVQTVNIDETDELVLKTYLNEGS